MGSVQEILEYLMCQIAQFPAMFARQSGDSSRSFRRFESRDGILGVGALPIMSPPKLFRKFPHPPVLSCTVALIINPWLVGHICDVTLDQSCILDCYVNFNCCKFIGLESVYYTQYFCSINT